MFKYEDYIREKILNYKFNDKPYYYKTFAIIFITNKKMCDILKSYDIIIPVPIHNKRRKQRGYNQTELIAKELAKKILNLEYMNILTKNANAKPQSLLNKEQRIENAKNVYGVIKNIDIENKNVSGLLKAKIEDLRLVHNKFSEYLQDKYLTMEEVQMNVQKY